MMQIRNRTRKPSGYLAYYEMASALIAQAEYEKALPYVDECTKLITKETNPDEYVDLMIKKGCLLTLLGREDEAIDPLNEVLGIKPDTKDVYMVLAQIYYDKGDFNKLGETLEAYLKIAPDDVDMRVTYAQSLYSTGDLEDAEKQFDIVEQSLTKEDEEMTNEVKHFKMLIDLQKGDFENAYEKLCEMDGLEDKYPDIYMNKGLCKMSLGEYDEAAEFYTTSIEKGQQVQYCYYTRGICELTGDKPDYEAAYNDLKMAVEYEGEDRDEETSELAKEILEQAFETEN